MVRWMGSTIERVNPGVEQNGVVPELELEKVHDNIPPSRNIHIA